MNRYISDTHLGHENILRHSKRPFRNVEEMDKIIIENWNSVVGPNDDIYIIGDLIYQH
jgi:calcineurin-like phosphoesterase family protein